MGTTNEPPRASILSDLLRHTNALHQDSHRPGIQTSLRSGQFPSAKTNYVVLSPSEPRIHAVGLNLRSICRCSEENGDLPCVCFEREDLACRGLFLSRNNLTDGRGLEMFCNLQTLSLADNLFDHVPKELQALVNLKRLNFAGNRLAEATPHCRERILAYSPSICELDGVKISTDEVNRAKRIIIDECVLKSIIYLLNSLRGCQGQAWEEDYEAVCRQMIHHVVATKSAATLEEFICSLREFFWNCNAPGEDIDIWTKARQFQRQGASSWNHAIAMMAVDFWDAITYPIEWKMSCFEDFSIFARAMTLAIDMLEVILRENEDDHAGEVEDTAMEIWAQFYILVSSFRKPSFSHSDIISSGDQVCVESSHVSACDQACNHDAQSEEPEGINEISDMVQELQTENDHLREKIEREKSLNDEICRDKQEMTAVLTLLQENLEDMNKKKAEVLSENQVLLERLRVAEYDAEISSKRLKELQSAYDEYRRDISSQLKAQEAQFTLSIASLMQKLDALEKEPRIPIHIEIINPDIRRSIKHMDETIKCMQTEIDFYRRNHDGEIRAELLRMQWKAQRLKNAMCACFASWRYYNRYLKSLNILHKSLQEISRQNSKQVVSMMLLQWLAVTMRSKRLEALSARVLSRRRKTAIRNTFEIWYGQHLQSMRIRSYTKIREQRRKQYVLEILWLHKCLWEQRTKEGKRAAISFNEDRLKSMFTKVWVETCRSACCARETRLQESRVEERFIGNVFNSWRNYNNESQIEALGNAFSNHRIASKSFHALAERSQRAKTLKLLYARLVTWKRRQTCEIVTQCWRDEVVSRKDRLSRDCLSFWYNTVLLQRYIRHRAAVQEEQDNAALRHVWSQWRAIAWECKHHKYKKICSIKERLKGASLLRQCWTSWLSTFLRDNLENQDIMIENMDADMKLLVSSCNSLETTIAENHSTYLQEMKKASTQAHVKEQNLKKEQRTIKRRLTMLMAETSTKRDTIKDLQAVKAAQDDQIASLQQGMQQLERDKYMLELRLRASEMIKASVTTRATRALKASSIATDTLLSVWYQHEPFSVTRND